MTLAPSRVVIEGPTGPGEQHNRQLRLHQQLTVRTHGDIVSKRSGRAQRLFNGIFIRARTMGGERKPQRKTSRPPREVVRVVRRIPHRPIDRCEIVTVLSMRNHGRGWIAVHQSSTVIRGEEPLVRVDPEA